MTTWTGTVPTIAPGDTTTVPTNLAVYRDALKAVSEAWTDYTPTATNWTIGNGTLRFKYLRVNKLALVRIFFAAGSTTAYTGSGAVISLPFTIHATGEQGCRAKVYDGTNSYLGFAYVNPGGSTLNLFAPATSTSTALGPMTSATVNSGTTGNWTIHGELETA